MMLELFLCSIPLFTSQEKTGQRHTITNYELKDGRAKMKRKRRFMNKLKKLINEYPYLKRAKKPFCLQ